MMKVIKARGIGKEFDLGLIGAGTLRESYGRLKRRVSKQSTIVNNKSFWALKDITFDVNQGDVLGIIGRNGAGKSTLLKILSQITPPTSGSIEVHGRLASLLEVGTGFHPELTGKENIYLNGSILGMKRKEISSKFDAIVEFSGIEKFLNTPVKRYSSGMYVRLAFAVAAHLEPEILVIDEVLAVGDHEFQAKCLGKMNDVAKSGRTVLFVSHNMAAVKSLCNKAILLEHGQIVNRGSSQSVVEAYLSQQRESTKKYQNELVSRVSIYQSGVNIILEVDYDISSKDFYPVLGFVVHRDDGEPLFANSQRINYKWPILKNKSYPQIGTIRVTISQPKLMDAMYNLSVFFGNGFEDFFVDRNCISFEVAGMTLDQQRILAQVGYISPECDYDIIDHKV